MNKTKLIQVRVTEEEHKRFASLAESRGESVSELVREAVERVHPDHAGITRVAREQRDAWEANPSPDPLKEPFDPRIADKLIGRETPQYRCPRDCKPNWRPQSPSVRCPACNSKTVPVT